MSRTLSTNRGTVDSLTDNGHLGAPAITRLFVFDQLVDLGRCALRPGNHSADGREVLEPVVSRDRGRVQRLYVPRRCGLRQPGDLRVARSRRHGLCDPAAGQPSVAGEDRPPAQASGWSTAARGAPLLFQLQIPGRIMEQAAPSGGQSRVAPRRALSAGRLHRHQPGAAGRARRRLLQPPRHLRAVHQGRQGRAQVDTPVVPLLRRQRGPSSVARFGCHRGWLRPNFVAVCLDETENRAR